MGKRNSTFGEAKSFTGELFDKEDQVEKAARIIQGIQETRSSRISDIALVMEGDIDTVKNYLDILMKNFSPEKMKFINDLHQDSDKESYSLLDNIIYHNNIDMLKLLLSNKKQKKL